MQFICGHKHTGITEKVNMLTGKISSCNTVVFDALAIIFRTSIEALTSAISLLDPEPKAELFFSPSNIFLATSGVAPSPFRKA